MRYSRQRECVYDVLLSTRTHPDAAWIYAKVRERLPNISLGTVYRNLGELCDAGMAKRISAVGCVERFDADTSQHAHFVCRSCGKITDVSNELVTVKCHFDGVEKTEVVAYGICSDCKITEEVT